MHYYDHKLFLNFTCVKSFVASTLLSMDSTKAAVFPVPDCDCAIMLFGLNIDCKQNIEFFALWALLNKI